MLSAAEQSSQQAAAAARSRCIVSYRSVQCIAFRRSCRRGRSSHRLASVNRLHASSRLDGRHDLLHLICLYDSPTLLGALLHCTYAYSTALYSTVQSIIYSTRASVRHTDTKQHSRGHTSQKRRGEHSTAQRSARVCSSTAQQPYRASAATVYLFPPYDTIRY